MMSFLGYVAASRLKLKHMQSIKYCNRFTLKRYFTVPVLMLYNNIYYNNVFFLKNYFILYKMLGYVGLSVNLLLLQVLLL